MKAIRYYCIAACIIAAPVRAQTQPQQTGATHVKDTIFREYDIRGKVDSELPLDQAYDLGRAIAYYLQSQNPACKTIAIGMDGRTHSLALKKELTRALTDSGMNSVFVGVCPTPALYFSLFTGDDIDGGIMITASHNGPEYNGIKLCLGTRVVWGKELQEIKNLYKAKKHIAATTPGTETDSPIIPSYIAWLTQHFAHLKNIPVSCIIDCGNGAAGTVMPELITQMGWKNVTLLYEKVDGTFPNHEADPTVEKNMLDVKQALASESFNFGIGLDGDCDRMAPMTKQGTLVSGDKLLALFAQTVLAEHPGAGVVFDIKSSSGLIELLEQWGAQPIMSPSGHSIIKDMMTKHGALLGGEISCHFFFKDRYFGYDDGIYAAFRLIELLHVTQQPLSELLSIFPKKESSQEFRLFCPDEKKQDVINSIKDALSDKDDIEINTMDGVRAVFPFGWGIVRASNTQAALSMRFESDTKDGLKKVIERFYALLAPHLNTQDLQPLLHAEGIA
jgi:phosphomannomutase / phosphoglucomutase